VSKNCISKPDSRTRRRPSAFARPRFRGALPRLRGRLSTGRDLNHRLRQTGYPRARLRGVVEHWSTALFPLGSLSRRDLRTQPGVLTPGTHRRDAHPEGVEDWTLGWAAPNRAPCVAGPRRPLGPLSPLHLAALPESRTARPTKPKRYVANRLGRPRKRGALHKMEVSEVGRTRTKRGRYPHVRS
jgi:hypothetical protein